MFIVILLGMYKFLRDGRKWSIRAGKPLRLAPHVLDEELAAEQMDP